MIKVWTAKYLRKKDTLQQSTPQRTVTSFSPFSFGHYVIVLDTIGSELPFHFHCFDPRLLTNSKILPTLTLLPVVLSSGSQRCSATLRHSNITCEYHNTIPNAAIYMSANIFSERTSRFSFSISYGNESVRSYSREVTGSYIIEDAYPTCSSIHNSEIYHYVGDKLGIWRVTVTENSGNSLYVNISIGSQDGTLAIPEITYQAKQEKLTYFTFTLPPHETATKYLTSLTVKFPPDFAGKSKDILGLIWELSSCPLLVDEKPIDSSNHFVQPIISSSDEIFFDLGMQNSGQMNVAIISANGPSHDLIISYSTAIDSPTPLTYNATNCAFTLISIGDKYECDLMNLIVNSSMNMDISVLTAFPAELSVQISAGDWNFPAFTLSEKPSITPSVTSFAIPSCPQFSIGSSVFDPGYVLGLWKVTVTDVNGTGVGVVVSLQSQSGFLPYSDIRYLANLSKLTYFTTSLPIENGVEMEYPMSFTVTIPSKYHGTKTCIQGIYWFTNITCYLLTPSTDPYSLSQFIPSPSSNQTSVTFDLGKQRSGLVGVGVFLTGQVQEGIVSFSLGEGKAVNDWWSTRNIILVSVASFVVIVLVMGVAVWAYQKKHKNDFERL